MHEKHQLPANNRTTEDSFTERQDSRKTLKNYDKQRMGGGKAAPYNIMHT